MTQAIDKSTKEVTKTNKVPYWNKELQEIRNKIAKRKLHAEGLQINMPTIKLNFKFLTNYTKRRRKRPKR